jgi:uncharacterized SAM-binding protein YcdF (DUF218 family)
LIVKKVDVHRRLVWKRRQKILKLSLLAGLGVMVVSLLLNLSLKLPLNTAKPVDAFLVLGGSIRREIYVAQLANQYPDLPILISQGSKDPCIWRIFQRENARFKQIWLEKCANSTFGNFFFGIPILSRWGVHKVKLITSPSHLPRAQWLGKILLGAHGIAMEVETVREKGVPGNQESAVKTALDVTRSLFWTLPSQIIQPPCFNLTELVNVDLQDWEREGFTCEHQGKVQ